MIVFTKKSIYIVQNIAYVIIHTPNPFSLEKETKSSCIFFICCFPTINYVFAPDIIPYSINPVSPQPWPPFFIFRQAVTKSQSTGQLLNFSSRLSVRQAVYKSSVSQITALEDVLSLTYSYLRSCKAFQCLWNLMKMNSSHWKTTEVIGNQSN